MMVVERNERFLGRIFDVNTQTWKHLDGSGGIITEEHRYEVLSACESVFPVEGLFKLFEIKERINYE